MFSDGWTNLTYENVHTLCVCVGHIRPGNGGKRLIIRAREGNFSFLMTCVEVTNDRAYPPVSVTIDTLINHNPCALKNWVH